MSIAFVVEMLSDINVGLFVIRDQNADQPRYLNTAWTMQLGRSVFNSVVLFSLSSWIASSIYHTPSIATPLRVFSVSFIISGLQSMSFSLAIRRKQARIIMYSELFATLITTTFSVIYCYYSRDYWGLIYGILLNRVVSTVISHLIYPDVRQRLQFDRSAAREIMGLARYTTPSSLLTLALSQFDKVVFLRLFDLSRLGVYGLAGNIAGSCEGLIVKISQSVLYPRCAHNFRTDKTTLASKYYSENTKAFLSILFLPAAVGGAAHLVIATLYPSRYAQAAAILQAFMLKASLLALASPAEDLLIATGEYQIILHGNVFRAAWMFIGSLMGYYLFGFMGFVYGAALSGLPPLLYYFALQRRKGLLVCKYELYRVAFLIAVGVSSHLLSALILAESPYLRDKG
jgi:O-antigen/teichoic acid export membrane protein